MFYVDSNYDFRCELFKMIETWLDKLLSLIKKYKNTNNNSFD